jgi:hypothetical protein
MKIMLNLNSAPLRGETPHTSDTLKRRAQAVINNKSIDAGTRLVIRYGLETKDSSLGDLVRRADDGETLIDNIDPSQPPSTGNDDSSEEKLAVEEKVEALAVLICRPGDDPERKSAALLVLMSTLQTVTDPKALAQTAKYVAFCRCAELNPYGMVEAQIEVLEDELLADHMFMI